METAMSIHLEKDALLTSPSLLVSASASIIRNHGCLNRFITFEAGNHTQNNSNYLDFLIIYHLSTQNWTEENTNLEEFCDVQQGSIYHKLLQDNLQIFINNLNSLEKLIRFKLLHEPKL